MMLSPVEIANAALMEVGIDPVMTADNSAIVPGTMIELRTASGDWIGPTVALSGPHLNVEHQRRRPWMVVSVQPDGWDHPINWPAGDVRLAVADTSTEATATALTE